MDPEACWKEIVSEISLPQAKRDEDRLYDLCEALLEWVQNAGFPPKITGHHGVDVLIARLVAQEIMEGIEHEAIT